MNGSSLLSWILWMPVIGVIINLIIPGKHKDAIRWASLINTAITLILSAYLYMQFDTSVAGMQEAFTISIPWIKQFHINYTLGVDGISFLWLS